MSHWKKIWNKDDRINQIILECLVKADGFDSGAGSFTLEDWEKYQLEYIHKLDISPSDTIYDVGCGSGAFLYDLYLQKHSVGGVDYSMSLINLANSIMPNGEFTCDEAININTDLAYDFTLSHSVFHYFKDLDYARDVVVKMIQKSNKKIGIFDINDKAKESLYHQIRMGDMGKQEYKEKYKGLDHSFYEKNWFKEIASAFNLKISIFDQTFENYSNSSLRFNVIMEKR
ncbi:class I SAM-dependent methyltransferase [Gammaproteobacteria bacterium]|nr:class I SAM-dependent methyltransferase [Gammaproteobacteria bacterium]MDC1277364.1 class I SAM-dependent methyltransferase [Gammaproteobacteria bacterium]